MIKLRTFKLLGLTLLLGLILQSANAETRSVPIPVHQSDEDVAKAIDRINQQGASATTYAVTNWNAAAQAHQESAESGVDAIQKRENETIRAMQRARIMIGNDGDSIPAYTPGQIARVAKTFNDQKDNLVNAEKQSQANAQDYGQKSAKTIKHDVHHLTAQLLGKDEPTGLKLVPIGTNLYVRNYAPDAPSK